MAANNFGFLPAITRIRRPACHNTDGQINLTSSAVTSVKKCCAAGGPKTAKGRRRASRTLLALFDCTDNQGSAQEGGKKNEADVTSRIDF